MEEINLAIVLQSFNNEFQAGKSQGIRIIEAYLNKNDISKVELGKVLANKIGESNFNWVQFAIDTNFVYTSDRRPPEELKVDDLLIFTDSYRWKEAVKSDALLSPSEREELKDIFREIGVQYYESIFELLENDSFDWFPFEVKHAYWDNFSEISYTNEDIIFHLKSMVWDYLFPDSLDKKRLSDLKDDLISYLEKIDENQGWVDSSDVVKLLSPKYPNLDLFELSQIEMNDLVERKRHYRNPFTFGFIRLKR